MDAYTRLRLEIEGYRELGMWEEAQTLLERFSDGVAQRPEILGFLAMLDVAIDFVGHTATTRTAPPVPVAEEALVATV